MVPLAPTGLTRLAVAGRGLNEGLGVAALIAVNALSKRTLAFQRDN